MFSTSTVLVRRWSAYFWYVVDDRIDERRILAQAWPKR
jgi:hypothetical protein